MQKISNTFTIVNLPTVFGVEDIDIGLVVVSCVVEGPSVNLL